MNPFEKTLNFFFNPCGRITRLDYAMSMALFWVIMCIVGRNGGMEALQGAAIFLVFPALCVGMRRWHDFGCRGWWWLLRFSPMPVFALMPNIYTYFAVQFSPVLLLLIECLIPGTAGNNAYGPMPIGLVYKPRVKASQPSRPAPKAVKAKPVAKRKKR